MGIPHKKDTKCILKDEKKEVFSWDIFILKYNN
jgi:hypothetical protein